MTQGIATKARFRSRLKQLMLDTSAQRGEPISQRQLAKEADISLSTVSRWYRDDNIVSLDADTLVKFMDYFQCKFEDLVEIER